MSHHSRIAGRISHLGTETAYSIAEEAAEFAKSGKTVYPFHIGDLNFPTAPIIVTAMKKAVDDGKTGYCAAAGIPQLRDALAQDIGKKRGVQYSRENISVQSGGKPVITKFLQVVMNPGDEVLYPSPGYPIYESQINYFGGVLKPYRYVETKKGFELDLDYLKSQYTPKTKILVYNNYQNPIGIMSSDEEMKAIAEFCVEHDLLVLSDEAYFAMIYDIEPKSIVALPGMKERTVILHTYSKSFSMTGWRLGAAVGPEWIISSISKLNTNDEACTTNFIQWAGLAAFTPEAEVYTKHIVEELRKRRDVLCEEINKVPGFHCHVPECTFYLFVNVTEAMKKINLGYEDFRKHVLHRTGVSFCTREHFGKSLTGEHEKYIRLAYSGISVDMIRIACQKLKELFENVPQ